MKFYDKVEIIVEWGKWWNGAVAWRREKFIPYGGPAWWDWGKWGDVILVGSKDENTLIYFRYKKRFKAEDWEHWKWHDMYWKKWEDLILKVPLWTVVKDKKTRKILFQFIKDWDKFVAAKWGRWGWWNIHFKSPTRQFPQFALLGEPWEKRELILELQMLWDVALIWFPSVWKSSIINAISNVKAKVADYPFTTIVPNLGVVKYKDLSFSIVDVPWLIKWASQWKGLWYDFLRHILKARIWVFVYDVWRYEEWVKEIIDLLEEIKLYLKYRFLQEDRNLFWKPLKDIYFKIECKDNFIFFKVFWLFENDEEELLFEKVIIFVFNKIDLINDDEILQELEKYFVNKISQYLHFSQNCIKNNIIKISAVWRVGLEKFLDKILELLSKRDLQIKFDFIDKVQLSQIRKDRYIKDVTNEQLKKLIDEGYIDESQAKYIKVWEVYDPYLTYLTFVLPWGNDEAELRFWEELEKKWILKWLQSYWVRKGDILKIISHYGNDSVRYIEL